MTTKRKAPANKSTAAVDVRGSTRGGHQHASVSVRPIDNGYIISHSHDGPKGYTHREVYVKTKPKITMPQVSTGPAARKTRR